MSCYSLKNEIKGLTFLTTDHLVLIPSNFFHCTKNKFCCIGKLAHLLGLTYLRNLATIMDILDRKSKPNYAFDVITNPFLFQCKKTKGEAQILSFATKFTSHQIPKTIVKFIFGALLNWQVEEAA